jgi:hypothetical protein
VAVLFIIFIFVVSSFATLNTPPAGLTPTPDLGIERGFPTVPPEGTRVIATQTFFHRSGLISVPKLEGWELPSPETGGGEETLLPTGESFGRVGLMFINSPAQSVVHVFAEKDPSRVITNVAELNNVYTVENLDAAWKDYTGGWKELSRGVEGDQYIINFEVTVRQDVNGQFYDDVYLARQLSKLDGEWLLTARLVVPSNNPALLDQLQQQTWSKFRFWRAALNSPLEWSVITDNALGFVFKYPPGWLIVEGSAGRPYTIVDNLQTPQFTVTMRTLPNTVIADENAAKAWVQRNVPQATLQSTKAEMINGVAGFSISYADPDPDGNQRSAIATLLNGANNTLYVITQQTITRGLDLLDISNPSVPIELVRIRESFFLIPPSDLVPTTTPIPTATAFLTPAP